MGPEACSADDPPVVSPDGRSAIDLEGFTLRVAPEVGEDVEKWRPTDGDGNRSKRTTWGPGPNCL
jgi:hypothetical protein